MRSMVRQMFKALFGCLLKGQRPDGHVLHGLAIDCRGSIATTLALLMLPTSLAVGAAVDYARLAKARDRMQSALDLAAVSAANDGTSAFATTGSNRFLAQLTTETVTPAASFTKDTSGTVSASATVDYPLTFGTLLGASTYKLQVTSTVRNPITTTKACILLKSTSLYAFVANSGANINATGCEIHVASTAWWSTVFNASTSIISDKFCIGGSVIIDNGGTHPNVQKPCTTTADPFAGTLPTPTTAGCDYNWLNYNGGAVTLNPGIYCGWINFNAGPTVTFNPGVYVIKSGGWNVNGGIWTGSGVTFYFDDTSAIQFNSSVKTTLSAPTTGTYAGILFYEKTGLWNSSLTLNTSAGHTLTGLIYLPSRNITLNSGASLTANAITLVANALTVNSANWTITPSTIKNISTGTSTSGSVSSYLAN